MLEVLVKIILPEIVTLTTQTFKEFSSLEDGIINGGFGEKIARFYGKSDMKVLNFGAHKEFTNGVPLAGL